MLTILFMFTFLICNIFAQGTPGLLFTSIAGGTAWEVARGDATAEAIVIPATHNGLPVTQIAANGFRDFATLTSISLPNTITTILQGAFSSCTGLTSITVPNSVTDVRAGAFSFTGLTSFTIPMGMQSINGWLFEGTDNLVSIDVVPGHPTIRVEGNCAIRIETNELLWGIRTSVMPNSVTRIGDHAFRGVRGLTSLIIPASVTSLGIRSFGDCINMTDIFIPISVTTINGPHFSHTFENCHSLTIYAEAPSQPAGWHEQWNPQNRPVVWGFGFDGVSIDPMGHNFGNTGVGTTSEPQTFTSEIRVLRVSQSALSQCPAQTKRCLIW